MRSRSQHFPENLLVIRFAAVHEDLVITSAGTFLGSGIQINFQVCIRQNHCANIASDHHHVAALPDAPLLLCQCAPYSTIGGNNGNILPVHFADCGFPR